MSKKASQKCENCTLLFHGGVRCTDSKEDTQTACERFGAGRPLRPYYKGRPITEVAFEPEESAAWSFWSSDQQILILFWEVSDHEYGYGRWRLQVVGLDHDGIVTQKLRADEAAQPAFYGEIMVKGSGDSDLWSSAGYEDRDQTDFDGNVTNKPREIVIAPTRKDG